VPGAQGVSARRRLARLVRTGSPRIVAGAVRRELLWRQHESAVRRAGRNGRRLLVGPFLGEVGFELLYWIPVVRRLLAEHGVERDRVTVLTRGGAGAWYQDVAADAVDVLDLVPAEDFLADLIERRRRTANAKQFFGDPLDQKLSRLALERVGEAAQVHPLVMYSRMRFVLEGLQPPGQATLLGDYRPLEWPNRSLPADCPPDFVAVKLYFTDPFPDDRVSRELARRVLDQLVSESEVVVLTSGMQLDEHREWLPSGGRIHDSSAWVSPQDNLAVQTALVARSRALVCSYGGFSYLGAMLGVPTVALKTQEPYSQVHLDVFRAAFPDARYTLLRPDESLPTGLLSERAAGTRP
jgi:hypothetical protein